MEREGEKATGGGMDETVMGVRSREQQERRNKETCFRSGLLVGGIAVGFSCCSNSRQGDLVIARENQVPASQSRGMH